MILPTLTILCVSIFSLFEKITNITDAYLNVVIWSIVEVGIGNFASSVATLRPLAARLSSRRHISVLEITRSSPKPGPEEIRVENVEFANGKIG